MRISYYIQLSLVVAIVVLGTLNTASAETYTIKTGSNLIGANQIIQAQKGNTLTQLAQQYDMGYQEILEANPHMSHNQLKPGQTVVIPSAYILPHIHQGIVVNTAELRLYYFIPKQNKVMTFPVALGRSGWRTPLATTRVTKKTKDPEWKVPASIRTHTFITKGKRLPKVMPAGPDNPLGHYALYLALHGYLIHGNNQPSSIGRMVSSGCIRMYNEDVKQLYKAVADGTTVHLVHTPYKVGWKGDQLYFEAQVPVYNINEKNSATALDYTSLIKQAISGKHVKVNWKKAKEIAYQHQGVPMMIGRKWA